LGRQGTEPNGQAEDLMQAALCEAFEAKWVDGMNYSVLGGEIIIRPLDEIQQSII
jgi:hypothetical protein